MVYVSIITLGTESNINKLVGTYRADMKGTLFLYKSKSVEQKTLTKMKAELFGKEQKSNFGRYSYSIRGKIPTGDYIRPIRAVVIVKEQFSDDVKKVFQRYGITYRSFQIEIMESDLKNQNFFKQGCGM
jgi:hypothetical protein